MNPMQRLARADHSATLLQDGRVLVAGGTASWGGSSVSLSSAWLDDPSTESWHRTGDAIEPLGQSHRVALMQDGRVLAFYSRLFQAYDAEAALRPLGTFTGA